MASIRCVVERITYSNSQSGWCVLKVRVKGFKELVALTGQLLDIPVGTVLQVEGDWRNDPQYGQQFVAKSWEEALPADVFGIEKYLGSGLIKGIGPVFARAIVKTFGADTLNVIDNEPDRLIEVPKLGKKRVEKIKESWEKQRDIKDVMVFLKGHGVSTAYAAKIYREYGKDSIDTVKANPYQLADDIWGIGFKTADSIARNMGYEANDPRRCRSGILYTFNELADEGHVYAEREQLADAAAKLLDVEVADVDSVIDSMVGDKDIIADSDVLYLPPFFHSENGSARLLRQLLTAQSAVLKPTEIKSGSGIEYDEVQLAAIQQALDSKVMVLTGGPGTGKTTTTQGIISAFRSCGLKILLAAPTGRAAKRMSEATGMEAKTIHRLLEYSPKDGYKRNDESPLDADALIVDECSMIDMVLFYNLMKAVPTKMRLVLVGDIDQLPSVGAGNVLRDIIDSNHIPVVRLTRIFRQAQSSRIIMNAHAINRGDYPNLSNGRDTDFFYIDKSDASEIAQTIIDLVRNRLPKTYGYKPHEIQVLTPMQRSEIGAANLNTLLQEALNPSGDSLSRAGSLYRQGDKVMQIRNNYDKNVFNGDIGYISAVNLEDRTLTIIFDGKPVEYDVTELDELTLAYAVTIHKSQGSEFPVVVIPVSMKHYIMLQRNLIYTGITRAKKICVLVGEKRAIAYAVKNQTVTARNTKLKERLQD